ncbi:class I SAM-dependent methyltransferase [Thalassomonas sp. RHCl1]|uniref:class I SAM-dependent methyltransferase n=1 Tax=Thalassomonas sp. RHCl1 TaxID=2995320 RepID=UPI00248ACEB0|nr:class I SAM-dependent methyltransferase [Thalassomonas sp. RHCl1]
MSHQHASDKWASYYRANQGKGNYFPENFVHRVFSSSSPVQFLDHDYRGKSLLDLGCGHGRHIPYLQSLGFEVCGLEVSAEQVSQLQQQFPGLEFAEGVAANIPLADNHFDYLLACNAIYYLDNAKPGFSRHIAESRRVLKNGGKMIFSMLGEKHTIFNDAKQSGPGLYKIAKDFLGFRHDTYIQAYTGDNQQLFNGLEIKHQGEIIETVDDTCRHLHYFVAVNNK